MRLLFSSRPGEGELLACWLSALLPVLDEFVAAAAGSPDVQFWGHVASMASSSPSGAEPLTGWIQCFFPYRMFNSVSHLCLSFRSWRATYEDMRRRGELPLAQDVARDLPGVRLSEMPCGLSKVPFTYTDLSTSRPVGYAMSLYGGLVSMHQDPATRALSVRSGWAVVNKGPAEEAGWRSGGGGVKESCACGTHHVRHLQL